WPGSWLVSLAPGSTDRPARAAVARRDRHQRGKLAMTQATARWIAVLILTTTACSRGRCTENQVPPVQPTQPPRETTLRKLNVEDYEAVVYGAAPNASFTATTSLEHDTLARLIPSLYDGARSAKPPDPKQWQPDAAAAGFEIQ